MGNISNNGETQAKIYFPKSDISLVPIVFNTNIIHIKSSSTPLMVIKVNITYQVMGRQDTTQEISCIIIFKKEYCQEYSNLQHTEDNLVHYLDI